MATVHFHGCPFLQIIRERGFINHHEPESKSKHIVYAELQHVGSKIGESTTRTKDLFLSTSMYFSHPFRGQQSSATLIHGYKRVWVLVQLGFDNTQQPSFFESNSTVLFQTWTKPKTALEAEMVCGRLCGETVVISGYLIHESWIPPITSCELDPNENDAKNDVV